MKSTAQLILDFPLGRRFVRTLGLPRTKDVLADITPILRPGASILDIGAGSCDVAAGLQAAGWRVTPCDVVDLSCVPGWHPTIFDGRRLPFPDDAFDTALLITVLHHARDPDALLREAGRVARSVIVQEDVFESPLQEVLTWTMDSLTNLEFIGHPHNNRRDCDWRAAFEDVGLRVAASKSKRYWRFFDSVTYLLER